MSPPTRHLKAFLLSNATCVIASLPTLAIATHWWTSDHNNNHLTWTFMYLATLWRFAVCVMVLAVRQPKDRRESNPWNCVARAVVFAAPLETLTLVHFMDRCEEATTITPTTTTTLIHFCFTLFVFEVLFDLGHYCAHRLCHSHPLLYIMSGHKKHHATLHPTPLSTFSQDPLDVVLSNVLPVCFAFEVLHRFSPLSFSSLELILAFGYKTWIEVAGHVGDINGRATSFPLCIWLPRFFHIELRTRDHDAHHSHGGKFNFSKRFTMWDKIFGTYVDVCNNKE